MKQLLILLILFFIASACERSYEEFSGKYLVAFSCDISKSPFNKVQTSGYFLTVRSIAAKGGFIVIEPDGREHAFPYTEIQDRVFNFGLAGLIIGQPYFGEGLIYAYDLGCPQCDRPSASLSVNAGGIATCAICNRAYDLNNGGTLKTGDGRPLYRYRTTLNGNVLMVHNN